MPTPPLLLASTSPRRRELMDRLGLAYTAYSPPDEELPEDGDHALSPAELACHNAGTKIRSARAAYPEHTLIAADTIVVLYEVSLGKPRDLAQAAEYLARLSGQRHTVLTALALALPGTEPIIEPITTDVFFRSLSSADIQDYLEKVPVLDKAGAYAFQEQGHLVVERIKGSADNVIGLPTETLRAWLQNAGYRVSDS